MLFTVSKAMELMAFLTESLPQKNRHNIKTLLRCKQIEVDGKIVSQFNFMLAPGQKVEVVSIRIQKEKDFTGLDIVYEDHHIIVINKHSGLLSMGTDTEHKLTAYFQLSEYVKRQHSDNKIFIIHRLDRDTSGLMVFAKSEDIKIKFQENWSDIIIERSYVAVVEGRLKDESGTVKSYLREDKNLKVYSSQNPDNGQLSVTDYKLLKSNRQYSLVKVDPETGRKNQIRVHMADLGHSIAGDKKYGAKTNPIGRLCLHAQILSFEHPVNKEKMYFRNPVPKKFLSLIKNDVK